jgi:SCP-2 sterol transfer family
VAATATEADWQRGQEALRVEVHRVVDLLRSIPDADMPAVGEWTGGEVAMHLSQVWLVGPGLARKDLSRIFEVMPSLAGTAEKSLIRDIWDLANVTTLGVQSDSERNLSVLAERIEGRAEEYFSECAEADPDALRPWMVEGVTIRQSTLTYYLLNETVMHGADIAHAIRRPWRIEPAHAAMVLGRFIVPIIQADDPRAFVNRAKATGVRATYDVRVRGGGSFYFVFDDGSLRIEEPSSRRVDCHISADPVAFLRVVWRRQSQWSAIAQGKLLAWGRKPWLGPQLRGFVRAP